MPYKKIAYQLLDVDEGTPVEIIPTHSGALYRLPDRDVELEDDTNMVQFGTFMGYPKCCIDEFTTGDMVENASQRPDNYPLVGTDYVPCTKCAESHGIVKLISQITVARICPTPFPDAQGVYSLEFYGYHKTHIG